MGINKRWEISSGARIRISNTTHCSDFTFEVSFSQVTVDTPIYTVPSAWNSHFCFQKGRLEIIFSSNTDLSTAVEQEYAIWGSMSVITTAHASSFQHTGHTSRERICPQRTRRGKRNRLGGVSTRKYMTGSEGTVWEAGQEGAPLLGEHRAVKGSSRKLLQTWWHLKWTWTYG